MGMDGNNHNGNMNGIGNGMNWLNAMVSGMGREGMSPGEGMGWVSFSVDCHLVRGLRSLARFGASSLRKKCQHGETVLCLFTFWEGSLVDQGPKRFFCVTTTTSQRGEHG